MNNAARRAYSNWAPTKIVELYEFCYVATEEPLSFVVRRKRLFGSLETVIDIVQCRCGLREIPIYPHEFYEKLYSRFKSKDYRRGMGVIAKHKDLIMEQWRNFIALCGVPNPGYDWQR